ncbi:hypothetical protein HDU85_005934 [Gaertneriomyces sp. JEL0708]|nr:hypothetical protein HDU85_005934 [Gaertneriomyces sp. JEL0708]
MEGILFARQGKLPEYQGNTTDRLRNTYNGLFNGIGNSNQAKAIANILSKVDLIKRNPCIMVAGAMMCLEVTANPHAPKKDLLLKVFTQCKKSVFSRDSEFKKFVDTRRSSLAKRSVNDEKLMIDIYRYYRYITLAKSESEMNSGYHTDDEPDDVMTDDDIDDDDDDDGDDEDESGRLDYDPFS